MTTDEILSAMLGYLPDDYDTSMGSFFYDLLSPVADELATRSNDIDSIFNNAFVSTATGAYLDRKVAEQGLSRRPSAFAKGEVTITGDVGSIVRNGVKVAAENVFYAVDGVYEIPESGNITVPVTCITGGAVGNVGVGGINRFPITQPGLKFVTNETAITGGYDAETDEELRDRFYIKVTETQTSGNVNDYIEWAYSVAGVGTVKVFPLWNGAGTVKVMILGNDGMPASDELIGNVLDVINAKKPIGANVTVTTAQKYPINVSANIVCSSLDDVTDEVKKSITAYLTDTVAERGIVSYAKIGSLIMNVGYVEDYSNLTINGGTSNLTIPTDSVAVCGEVTLT